MDPKVKREQELKESMTKKELKPNFDLSQLLRQLRTASRKERTRLLRGLHDRLWHAPHEAMISLLKRAMAPEECLELVAESLSGFSCENAEAYMTEPPCKGIVWSAPCGFPE